MHTTPRGFVVASSVRHGSVVTRGMDAGAKQAIERFGFGCRFGGARRDERSHARRSAFLAPNSRHRAGPEKNSAPSWGLTAPQAPGRRLRICPTPKTGRARLGVHPVERTKDAATSPRGGQVVGRDGALIRVDDDECQRPVRCRKCGKSSGRLGCYRCRCHRERADTCPHHKEMLITRH